MGARATYLTGGGNPIQGFDRMSISSSAGLGVLDLHGTFDTEVPGESCSVSASLDQGGTNSVLCAETVLAAVSWHESYWGSFLDLMTGWWRGFGASFLAGFNSQRDSKW